MRPIFLTVGISCVLMMLIAGWTWERWLNTEISVTEYGALYGLRRMDPEFFRETLLPELEKALADGRMTNGELRDINKKISGFGPAALNAFKKTPLDEQLSKSLSEAQRKGTEAGRSVGEALEKALDDLSGFIERKSEELTRPKEKAQEPSTF